MSVTIRDVAKKARVGIATVSRVINGSPSVSEETRNRILQAIEELNYTPNPIARRLSTGRTLTIGAIVPFFTLPDFVKRLQGVQSVLAESEYDLVLYNVDSPAQRDKYLNELPRKSRVDGLLVLSLPIREEQAVKFTHAGTPIVLVDFFHPGLDSITVDHVMGAAIATRHLIDLGHTRIAMVSDSLENPFNFPATRLRHQGYSQALEAAGIPVNPAYHIQGEHGRENARQLASQLFTLPEPPSAIFAATDTQAIGILEAARQSGIRVPNQLSVVGYNDIRDAEYMNLTTVRQPLFESGVRGVERLLELIENPDQPPEHINLPLELVIRSTTAQPS